jgi:hypothetical protein
MSRLLAPDYIDPLFDYLDVLLFLSSASSLLFHYHGASSFACSLCAAPYPQQPQQLHADHGYPMHDILDIVRKCYHLRQLLASFHFSHIVCTTPTFQLLGV